MEKLAVMEREKRELQKRAKALAKKFDKQGLEDDEATELTELREKAEGLDKKIANAKWAKAIATEKEAETIKDSETRSFDAECRAFSLARAIRIAMGRERLDGREAEVSREVEKRSALPFEGMPVPMSVLDGDAPSETRAVTTTAPSAGTGSRIIQTDYRPGDYIPLLRDQLVARSVSIPSK